MVAFVETLDSGEMGSCDSKEHRQIVFSPDSKSLKESASILQQLA